MAETDYQQTGSATTTQYDATSPADAEKQARMDLEKFLRIAQERFQLAAEASNKNRTDSLDDLKFRIGEQWPDNIQTMRENDGRPCLTINRLPAILRQITNEQRQQRPSVQVNPVGSGSDVDVAEALQGIIRHIEVNSDAEIAYDGSFEWGTTCGFPGFWEICTDYIDQNSFDQEIYIKRIRNPFTIYWDPSAIEPTLCDADWYFQVEDIPEFEYKREYPNSAASSLTDFTSIGDRAPHWANKDTIRVAKYWHVEYTPATICLLDDNTVVEESQVPPDKQILRRRDVQKRKVVCSKINALEILEESTWPGIYIPLVPFFADDIDVDGKRHMAGIVRDAKDPQRMYNYWVSSGTEMIALAPRAPFVGVAGSFAGHEGKWNLANVKNYPYLEYEPISIAGSPAPPPQRQTFEPPVQAITLMTRQADNDLKSVVGIYDPTLGQNKSDQSGRAVALLQKQSDISNLNFSDNLSRAIRYTGKLLLDLIPKIYDAPRMQRIINPDGSVDHVGVYNGEQMKGMSPQQVQTMLGVNKVYDVGTGRYDVTVSVGPSYQTKRQEAVASQIEVLKVLPPQFASAVIDMVIRNMDWPQSQEMADRIKKLLPPQLQDDATDTETQLAQAQATLQQMGQQNQLLQKALQEATDMIKTKQIEQQGKFAIQKIDNDTKVLIAEIQTKAQVAIERATMFHEVWKEIHGSAHEVAMQKDQQAADQQMAETQAQQPQQQGASNGGSTSQ